MKFFKLPDALNRRTEARKRKKPVLGFTLVELVIVIAVLAILSGVGVLGYSGYIEYAQRAADEELISAVNTAFAAACEENEVVFGDVETAEPEYDGNCITGISSVNGENLSSLDESFRSYYAGNEKTSLTYYQGLKFKKGVGFEGSDSREHRVGNVGTLSVKKSGDKTTFTMVEDSGETYTYTVNNEDLEKYPESTYGQNMTVSGLMDEIDKVAGVFEKFLDNDSLRSNAEQFESELKGVLGENLSFDRASPDYYKQIGNALILGVAAKSDSFDAKATADAWAESGFDLGALLGSQENGFTGMASQLALGYALVTGFANSGSDAKCDFDGDGVEETAADFYASSVEQMEGQEGLGSAFAVAGMLQKMMKTQEFKDYYQEHGDADINGYLSAMHVINDNKDTLMKDNNVVNSREGVADDDLGAIFDAIFGGQI